MQEVTEKNFSNRKAMLFVRWKKAFRNRYTGTDCKTPIGAVVKSHGAERMRKRQYENCQLSVMKLNESEELMKHR